MKILCLTGVLRKSGFVNAYNDMSCTHTSDIFHAESAQAKCWGKLIIALGIGEEVGYGTHGKETQKGKQYIICIVINDM